MGVGLLAAVPCIHLNAALETCRQRGRVAFASDAKELFLRLEKEGLCSGLATLVYASRPELGHDGLFVDKFAAFRGTLVRWVDANNQGKHPDPMVRPVTTESDGPVWGFWELSDFVRLSRPEYVRISDLRQRRGKKNFVSDFVPHGPILVEGDAL
jgi:hypothetical protein